MSDRILKFNDCLGRTIEIVAPSLHLNGTGYGELYDKFRTPLELLNAAKEALSARGPHSRDYYVQNTDGDHDTYIRAAREHLDRVIKINEVIDELGVLLHEVICQHEERG